MVATDQTRAECPAGRHGLTLVETLVVIAILGVLVGLALPTLYYARRAGENAGELANLRTHASALQFYTADYADQIVAFSDRPTETVVVVDHVADESRELPYFLAAQRYWALPMRDYYEGRFFHPSQLDRRGVQLVYELTASAFAQPEYWRDTQREGPHQWRYTRITDVAHPSGKVGFVGMMRYYDESRRDEPAWPMALFDGSAAAVNETTLTQPYPAGEGGWPGAYHHFGIPGHHTIDGLSGVDLRSR